MAAGSIKLRTGYRWNAQQGANHGGYRSGWDLTVPANNYAGTDPAQVFFNAPEAIDHAGGSGHQVYRSGADMVVGGILAAPTASAVAVSSDGGATWAAPTTPPTVPAGIAINKDTFILLGGSATELVLAYLDPATGDAYVATSADVGVTWSAGVLVFAGCVIGGTVHPAGVNDVARDGANIVVAGFDQVNSGGAAVSQHSMAYSTDGGATFAHPAADPGYATGVGTGEATFVQGNGTDYAVVGNDHTGIASSTVAVTTDGGATWTNVGNPEGAAIPLTDIYRDGALIILTHGGNDVVRSTDGGATWSAPIQTGITVPVDTVNRITGSGTTIAAWLVSPTFSAVVSISHDGGATWSQPATSPAGFVRKVVCDGPNNLMAVGPGVFTSDDAGSTWTSHTTPVTNTVWCDRHGTDLAVVGAFLPSVEGSVDTGTTWTSPAAADDPLASTVAMRMAVLPLSGTAAATIAAGWTNPWDALPAWMGTYYTYPWNACAAYDAIDPTVYVIPAASRAVVATDATMTVDPASDPDWFRDENLDIVPFAVDHKVIRGFDTTAQDMQSWDDGTDTLGPAVSYAAAGSVPGFPAASLATMPLGADGNLAHQYIVAPTSTVDPTADFEVWQMDGDFNVANIWSIHTGRGSPSPGSPTPFPNSNLLAADPADGFVLVWAPLDNGDGTGHIYRVDTATGALTTTYATPLPPGDPAVSYGNQLGISLDGAKAYWTTSDAAATPNSGAIEGIEHDLATDTFAVMFSFWGWDLPAFAADPTSDTAWIANGPVDLSSFSPAPVTYDNYSDYSVGNEPQVFGFTEVATDLFAVYTTSGPFLVARNGHARWGQSYGAATHCTAVDRSSIWVSDFSSFTARFDVYDGFWVISGPTTPTSDNPWSPMWPGPNSAATATRLAMGRMIH